ncbi:hypothetical protein E1301_Tti011017 [Triplophysa tibetana]|uniref:Uncharacterized protein n=1 Tax=Triplophysa tibetana TaxID=1572043 RepID=A0A5A9MXV0_9TELE|nr:hypothetical protein E1301_Tti011017 [Triplophysa tibetana]
MNLFKSLDTSTSADISRKMLFPACQNLTSGHIYRRVSPHPAVPPDPWSIKAPDFTPKLYKSLGLPGIKRKNAHLLKSKDKSIITENMNNTTPSLLPGIEQKRYKAKPFITCYKPPDSLESKLLFAKTGKYPMGPYKDPKPHNFRPCAEGMPDIITSLDKDYGGFIFKSENLTTVTESQHDLNISHRDKLSKMDTFKPAEPKWDSGLILPKIVWPPKSASYSRHLRRRGAYSALMGRVEEKLTKSWRK